MKRSARNSSIVPSRRSVYPFVIKSQLSDSQNLGTQGHVIGLLLSALISTSVLITIATAALWTVNFAYLTSFVETLGFSYSDFDVTPQEQLAAAWQSVLLVSLTLIFISALVAVVPSLFLALWSLFETLWRLGKPWTRKIAQLFGRLRHWSGRFGKVQQTFRTKRPDSSSEKLTGYAQNLLIGTGVLSIFVFLLIKSAQDAGLRGKRDALIGIQSATTVFLKLNDGTSSQCRYIRRVGDKIIVAPTTSSPMASEKCLVTLLRRADIASITSSVDASSKLAELKNEVKAADWRPIIYLSLIHI